MFNKTQKNKTMKKRKVIKKGSSDFKTIIEDNGYFVDKTMLIKDFFEDSSYTLLMPRPKRFGKTLNLSMIEYFFDIQKLDSAKLFTEFEIADEIDFCKEHQNKYPVINISLKSIKETNWNKCLDKFKSLISKLYQKNYFLLNSEKLNNSEKQIFEKIVYETSSEAKLKESLESLSNYLQKHFNERVIILVDEYDAPIISAFQYTQKPIRNFQSEKLTYYENLINFMQGFLGDAFKGNESSLKKGLLTGVMRIGKESIFSDWNNFEVYGITSPYYDDKFGFTKQETKKLLTYFGLQNEIKKIAEWYDGYKFGETENIYNPWSIVNYISKQKAGFRAYWVNTSNDSMLKERIKVENIKNAVVELINNKTIIKTIKENFVFADFEHNTELIWTLLFNGGFITPVKEVSLYRYKFRIPNFELKFVFTNIILEWIANRYKFNQDLLINTSYDLINNNLSDFEIGFRQIIGDTLSYFDIAPVKDKDKKEIIIPKERFFHIYTLGLLAILSDDYIINSNRESGEGRYDIILIPRNIKNNGIIIEIKQIENQQENEGNNDFIDRINDKIDEALEQIERKRYYKTLLAHKIEIDKIKRVPIVFAGKEPYITKIIK